jgi:hypothetical protein
MPEKDKRRLIPIIDRRFQFKYTAVIVGVAAATSIVLGTFLFSAYREMNQLLALAGVSGLVVDKVKLDDAQFVFRITVASLVAEVGILGVLGLVITHRVCGPIFVVTRHLQTMVDGKYPTLRSLRSGDEFASLFDALQEVVETGKVRDADEVKALRDVLAATKTAQVGEREQALLQSLIDERNARLADAQKPGA